MKYVILSFLLVTSFCFAKDKKIENSRLHALTGFQKFEVITLFSPHDAIDQNAIYDSVTESFKKFGKIALSEDESMFKSLLQSGAVYPLCFFSIEKGLDTIEVSMDVLAEVEVLANKYKTTCPIWKKTLFAPVPPDGKTGAAIANLTQEMIKSLAEDCIKANHIDSNQLSFHIRKFKEL